MYQRLHRLHLTKLSTKSCTDYTELRFLSTKSCTDYTESRFLCTECHRLCLIKISIYQRWHGLYYNLSRFLPTKDSTDYNLSRFLSTKNCTEYNQDFYNQHRLHLTKTFVYHVPKIAYRPLQLHNKISIYIPKINRTLSIFLSIK